MDEFTKDTNNIIIMTFITYLASKIPPEKRESLYKLVKKAASFNKYFHSIKEDFEKSLKDFEQRLTLPEARELASDRMQQLRDALERH